MKNWSTTKEDIARANEYARMVCEEINVKEIGFTVGEDENGSKIKVAYFYDTVQNDTSLLLDVYKDGQPQNKHDFAAWLFLKLMRKDS